MARTTRAPTNKVSDPKPKRAAARKPAARRRSEITSAEERDVALKTRKGRAVSKRAAARTKGPVKAGSAKAGSARKADSAKAASAEKPADETTAVLVFRGREVVDKLLRSGSAEVDLVTRRQDDDEITVVEVKEAVGEGAARRTRTSRNVGFMREAIRIANEYGLSDVIIAKAVGAAPSTVREWLNQRSAPSGARAERVAELGSVLDRLGVAMDADYIPVWLLRPVPALDDRKPADVIAAGQHERVADIAAALEYPGVS
jgi:Holliday junction resolvase-like predicted endonuclease